MLLESYFKKQRGWGLFKDFMAHRTPWEVGSRGWECGQGLKQLVKARPKETRSRGVWSVLYPGPAVNGLQPSHILAMVVQIQSSQREDLAPLVSKSRHFPLPPALQKHQPMAGISLKERGSVIGEVGLGAGGKGGRVTPIPGPRGGSPVSISSVAWFIHDGLLHGDPESSHSSKPPPSIVIKSFWVEMHQWTEQTESLPFYSSTASSDHPPRLRGRWVHPCCYEPSVAVKQSHSNLSPRPIESLGRKDTAGTDLKYEGLRSLSSTHLQMLKWARAQGGHKEMQNVIMSQGTDHQPVTLRGQQTTAQLAGNFVPTDIGTY